MSSTRQLAAILFTDIAGYTAMMQKDEATALAVVRKYTAVLVETVASYRGAIVNDYGDGNLCTFSSATEAMRCAMDLQRRLQTEPQVPLRVGLHIGEVIFENEKPFGDGVNVASRIQSLGVANSILFSAEIHSKISNQAEFSTISLGTFSFKNVSTPMEVFALANEGLVVPAREQMEGKLESNGNSLQGKGKSMQELTDNRSTQIKRNLSIALFTVLILTALVYSNYERWLPEPELKSIAVLPFVNMSNDPEQEYFSDGITEDIITQVSKISDLKVISRTSVMQYKATDKTSRQIGKELDVATILEGSIRREGNQIRVVAQLIDARTNEHLWAETYDKELTHMFAIQSNVAEQIASALKAKLTQTDKEGIEKKPTENPAAYDLYLRGKFHLREDSRQEIDSAIMIIEQAVATDSKFALAYVALAGAYNEIFFTYEANKKWSELAFVALEKALAIDPSLPEAYVVRARLLWTHENKFPHAQAVAELRHVLSLRPNFGEARVFLSVIFAHIGLYDKAFEEAQKALELNPLDLATQTQLGDQFYYVQKYLEAFAVFEKLPKDFGGSFRASRKAEVLLRLGRIDEAGLRVQQALEKFPNEPYINSVAAILYAARGEKKLAEERIKISSRTGETLGHFHHVAYNLGVAFALMNNRAEAIRWLQKTTEDGLHCFPLFANDPYLNNLRSDPQFKLFLGAEQDRWEGYNATL